ncbi:MAG: cation transporter, partial [Planctomycetales bacterium]|nr:cation transporter [Planctomycetales bacterium]
LNVIYVIAEAGAGGWTGSLALISDAGHNLGDVLGLLMAWAATGLARRRPTAQRTYGLGRVTILASLLSGTLLLVAVGAIAWEAVDRLIHPAPVPGLVVVAVAAIGVVINTATALLFMKDRHADLNIRGAYLHMAADAAVSLGVVIAGVLIWSSGWIWLDPALSLVIAVIIFWGTWGLLKEATHLAVDGVPRGIETSAVREMLLDYTGVADVHDLHIWGLSTTNVALTAHLVMPEHVADDELLQQISHELHEQFGIDHATIQIERGHCAAACEPA